MSIDKKVKFAIVGCGHIGKRHADLVMKHPHAELVATADPLCIDLFDVPHYKNMDDMLASGVDIDVVNICTPNGLHAQQAVTCLKNRKHVVVEKPIALSTVDAFQISNAAIENERYVFPVVQNRYSPTVKWLKEIVSNNQIGKIFMVQLNCFWNRDDRYYTKNGWRGTLALDGGPLFTQFSHFIDVLLWVFGDIENIQTKFSNFNHQNNTEFEDSGMVLFDFVTGGQGCLNYSTSVYDSNFESSITIIGEDGTVKIGGQYMNRIDYCHAKRVTAPSLPEVGPVNDYGSYHGSASNHHLMMDNVIKVILGIDKQDVILADGREVVNVIEKIYAERDSYNYQNREKRSICEKKILM